MNPQVHLDGREYSWRIQDLVASYGWDRVKTTYPEARRLLQVMGTEVGRMLFGEDVWVSIADGKILDIEGDVVITDVRFENEAAYVRDELGGEVWWIYRAGVGPVNDHASDNIDFPVDRIIPNNGSLDELYGEIDSLISYVV